MADIVFSLILAPIPKAFGTGLGFKFCRDLSEQNLPRSPESFRDENEREYYIRHVRLKSL